MFLSQSLTIWLSGNWKCLQAFSAHEHTWSHRIWTSLLSHSLNFGGELEYSACGKWCNAKCNFLCASVSITTFCMLIEFTLSLWQTGLSQTPLSSEIWAQQEKRPKRPHQAEHPGSELGSLLLGQGKRARCPSFLVQLTLCRMWREVPPSSCQKKRQDLISQRKLSSKHSQRVVALKWLLAFTEYLLVREAHSPQRHQLSSERHKFQLPFSSESHIQGCKELKCSVLQDRFYFPPRSNWGTAKGVSQ